MTRCGRRGPGTLWFVGRDTVGGWVPARRYMGVFHTRMYVPASQTGRMTVRTVFWWWWYKVQGVGTKAEVLRPEEVDWWAGFPRLVPAK